MSTGIIATLLPALLLVQSASAQEMISTDRPGLGYSAFTVPVGRVQLELGVPALAIASGGGADTRLVNFPVLVRVGLTSALELRAGSTLLNSLHIEEGAASRTEDGFGAIEVGAKLALAPARGPALALIPSVILPVGDDDFSADDPAYTLNGVAAWTLPAPYGLTTVAGLSANPDAAGDYTTSGALVGVLGRALGARTSAYVEAGWYPVDGADPAYAGAGVAHLLSPMVQLDAFVDRGLTAAATDWLFGLGASLRF